MRPVLMSLVGMALMANCASAAELLSDVRLDAVTAGLVLSIDCPGCTLASSTSMSTNGVTTSASSTVTVPTPTGSPDTGGGGGGGGPTTQGPSVQAGVQVPPTLASIVTTATVVTVTH